MPQRDFRQQSLEPVPLLDAAANKPADAQSSNDGGPPAPPGGNAAPPKSDGK